MPAQGAPFDQALKGSINAENFKACIEEHIADGEKPSREGFNLSFDAFS